MLARKHVEGKDVKKFQTRLDESVIRKMYNRSRDLGMYMGRYITELIEKDCKENLLKKGGG